MRQSAVGTRQLLNCHVYLHGPAAWSSGTAKWFNQIKVLHLAEKKKGKRISSNGRGTTTISTMRCNFQPRLTSSVCRKTRVVHPCQKESNKVGLFRHTAIQHRSFHVAPLFLHGRNPTYRRQTSIIFCTVVSFFLKLFVEGKAGVAHVGSSIKGFYEAKKEFLFFSVLLSVRRQSQQQTRNKKWKWK